MFLCWMSLELFLAFKFFLCGDKNNISQVPVGDCLTAGQLTQLCKVSVPLLVIFRFFRFCSDWSIQMRS